MLPKVKEEKKSAKSGFALLVTKFPLWYNAKAGKLITVIISPI
jgi:hypothetical protein